MAHGINTVLMNENSARSHKSANFNIGDTSTAQGFGLAKPITDAWTTVITAADRVTFETDFILKDGVICICISHAVPIWS
ncbi:hypothetical protein N7537_004295 [Penicillium hordei]|uniref:Uncharacterized protein n=1 Tax=Penicillium hordei TaxID=40994 RepID=A0AAD6H4S1_9EURO|nr:uncharacterized protein N7537_004295 [Penicillium hordei]KAJ5607676.1 hypothetical protein N7537_004295 [Penicillium hordei]